MDGRIIGWALAGALTFCSGVWAGESGRAGEMPIRLAQSGDVPKIMVPNVLKKPSVRVDRPKTKVQQGITLKPSGKAKQPTIVAPVAPKVTRKPVTIAPKRPSAVKRAIRRAPPKAPSAPGTAVAAKSQVAQMQRSLTALGFSAGAADGISGKKTRAAIMAYQSAIGLPRSGTLTPEQQEVLALAAAMVPASSRAVALSFAHQKSPKSMAYEERPAMVAAAAAAPARPTRKFAGPGQFPPRAYRGYGILAFEASVSDFDRERYQMICQAYVTAMRSTFEVSTPTQDQFVTVWPLDNDALANKLNHTAVSQLCDDAIDNYGIDRAEEALRAASKVGFIDDGIGPYLLGWLPAESYDREDALILVLDLSHVHDIEQARAMLSEWKQDIQSDPDLLRSGFSLEALRRKIRRFADKYGEGFLSLIS